MPIIESLQQDKDRLYRTIGHMEERIKNQRDEIKLLHKFNDVLIQSNSDLREQLKALR